MSLKPLRGLGGSECLGQSPRQTIFKASKTRVILLWAMEHYSEYKT